MSIPAGPFVWRPMAAADLPLVIAIAERVHPDYPEDDAVFSERLALYPAGCHVLATPRGVHAYLISHPWHFLQPPALGSRLGALPEVPTTYYLHDLALLPEARGCGAAKAIVTPLVAHAQRTGVPNLSLVAVNGSTGFWQRNGFHAHADAALDDKLRSYDDAARLMVRPLR